MNYPNAYSAVKLLFWSEILLIIVAAAAIIATALGIGTDPAATEDITKLLSGPVGIVLAFSAVIAFIAAIMGLVGYIKGAKDDPWFFAALLCILFGAVISILSSLKVLSENSVFNSVSSILNELTTIFAIFAIISLANKVGDKKTAKFANTLLLVIILAFAASIVLTVVIAVTKDATASLIILIATEVLEILAGIMYLVALKKAEHMLE